MYSVGPTLLAEAFEVKQIRGNTKLIDGFVYAREHLPYARF